MSKTNYKDLSELASEIGDNLNIFEEKIDIEVQKLFMLKMRQLTNDSASFKLKQKEVSEHLELFDDDSPVNLEYKKTALVILSTIPDVKIYRFIEKIAKNDGPEKAWATIALQQSQMRLQSKFQEDPGVFISTGLGGKNNMLRYFCVLFYCNGIKMEDYIPKAVERELNHKVKECTGEIESISFTTSYIKAILLLPITANLPAIFPPIIEECNKLGTILKSNILVTNVMELSDEEIMQLSHS